MIIYHTDTNISVQMQNTKTAVFFAGCDVLCDVSGRLSVSGS